MRSKSAKQQKSNTSGKSQVVKSVNEDIAAQVVSNPDFIKRLERDVSTAVMQVTKMHSGPLPDPETLAGYERVAPGSAERIILMAEKQQDHRHNNENKQLSLHETMINGDCSMKKRGQWFGLFSVLIVSMFSFYLAFLGHISASVTVITVVLIGLTSVFVMGRIARQKEKPEEPEPE